MVIVVDLGRTELTLVYDIVWRQRTNVKVVFEPNLMTCVFPQDVELSRKIRVVELALFLGMVRVTAIVVCENDKWL